MHYVGLDVHKRQSTFCVLDEHGRKLMTRTIRGPWHKVIAELGHVKKPFEICFEASTGYGFLYDALGQVAERVVVAHPGHLRLIFRSVRKNDRLDAAKLAKVLYLGVTPTVHVPSVDVRAWRRTIQYRERLVQDRTRVKNQVRALLRSQGVDAPRRLWSKKGLTWLRQVEWPTELHALQRDMLLERIESLDAMVIRVEKGLDRIAREHPGVQLLMTVPGVGPRTGETVMAYIDDPARFRRNNQVASYFGVVPRQDASGTVNRLGHITRQGPPTVRRVLTQAAWLAIRHSPGVRAYFERILQGNPERKKIALVATAHYMLRVMTAMLRTGEAWRSSAA